jgi:hypothetical protein
MWGGVVEESAQHTGASYFFKGQAYPELTLNMMRNHGNAPSQWCDKGAFYLLLAAEGLSAGTRYTTCLWGESVVGVVTHCLPEIIGRRHAVVESSDYERYGQ